MTILNTSPDIEKVLTILTDNVAMSMQSLSKKTGISVKDLRLLIDQLINEGLAKTKGGFVWLTIQEDEFGRLDWSKIPELEHWVGLFWNDKNVKK